MRRAGETIRNINFGYLKKSIEAEGYSVTEVSEAIGSSQGHLNKCIREKRIYKEDLDKVMELVPMDEKRLFTIPKEEPKEEVKEEPKTVSMDEALEMIKNVEPIEEETDIREELAEIKDMLQRVLLAMERGGFIQKSYDEIARDVLRKMLDKGRCTKEDYISELAKCGVRPPGTHCDKAIKDLGVIEAVSRNGKLTYTWLIRE